MNLSADVAARRNVNEDDVRLIRALYRERVRLLELADQLTIARIAAKFDLSFFTTRDIVFYQTYKNVKDLADGETL